MLTRLENNKETVECEESYDIVKIYDLIEYSLIQKPTFDKAAAIFLSHYIARNIKSQKTFYGRKLNYKTDRKYDFDLTQFTPTFSPPEIGISPLNIFISYSKHDKKLKDAFLRHLSVLERTEKIVTWDDNNLKPAEDWDETIKLQLLFADVIVLLVSSYSLATNYIWEVELKEAMQKYEAGNVKVIPIILSDCDWQNTPFAKLNALPEKGKAIKSFRDKEAAWAIITAQIRQMAEEFRRDKVFK